MFKSLATGGRVLVAIALALRAAMLQAPAPKQHMQQMMQAMYGETKQSTVPRAASPSITRMLMPPTPISVKDISGDE